MITAAFFGETVAAHLGAVPTEPYDTTLQIGRQRIAPPFTSPVGVVASASKDALCSRGMAIQRMDGEITALFIARGRKHPRDSVHSLMLLAEHGVEGDVHAGPGDRQVVLFEEHARGALDDAENRGLCYARFHENVRVSGLSLGELAAGTRLACGEATLEITSARKRCFEECRLSRADCHILSHVAFARVVGSGTVSIGSPVTAVPAAR
ncbi:MAG: MOSC domain-containing protein [Spirochaetota bacterium]